MMRKIGHWIFWLALFVLLAACSEPAEEISPTATTGPTPTTPPVAATAEPDSLYVNPAILAGAINPLVYGSNTGPWAGLPANGLEDYQNAGLTILRFPGGNWGDENILRPNQVDFLMDIAGMINAEVLLHVNLLNGTVDDALELLRYTNEEKGYDVKYWSIGNEPTLYNDKPFITGWDTAYYNERWREFAEAMKTQDPDILLVGPDVHQFTAVDANNPKDNQGRDWMREFLRANGDLVDIVAMHRYPYGETNPTIEDLRQNSQEWDQTIPFLRELISEETGRELPISVTEVNSNWSNTLGGEATPDSFYNAIWWADVLGRMINQNVEMVNHWMLFHPRDGTGILGRDGPRPTYYVYQMYRQYGHTKIHADAGVEDVSIFAAQRDDGAVTLMIINRADQEQEVPLTVESWTAGTASLILFDESHQAESLGAIPWSNGEPVNLPGQSISLLILE